MMPTNFDNIVPNATGVSSAFSSYRPSTGRPHEGVDITALAGSPIYSPPVNGVVVQNITNNKPGQFGNYMVIRTEMADGTPVFTVYGHLQNIPINPATAEKYIPGDPIHANTQFGEVGNSGINLQGQPYRTHLHYEERIGTSGQPDNWKDGALSVDPQQNYFGYTGSTLNLSAITGGIAPIGIPGAPLNPGLHYTEINSPVQTGRLYDNGVLYTKDTQTGTEFWSVPTATGGVVETTQFAGGQVTSVQYTPDPVTGILKLDAGAPNVLQFIQQEKLSLLTQPFSSGALDLVSRTYASIGAGLDATAAASALAELVVPYADTVVAGPAQGAAVTAAVARQKLVEAWKAALAGENTAGAQLITTSDGVILLRPDGTWIAVSNTDATTNTGYGGVPSVQPSGAQTLLNTLSGVGNAITTYA
jgi:hypothetical protein